MIVLYIFGFVLILLGVLHLVYPDFLGRFGIRNDRVMAETIDRGRFQTMNRIRGIVLLLVGVVAIVSAALLD